MAEQSIEVPEELAKAVAMHLTSHSGNEIICLGIDAVDEVLAEVAAPDLRKQGADQERQRLKEALLGDNAIEAAAKSRWERHWTDPQGMADWDEAKRRGMPDPAAMLRETRGDFKAALDTLEADRG